MGEYRAALKEIGSQLDRNVFPRVGQGGLVMPGEHLPDSTRSGKEKQHVREPEAVESLRPAAGSRQGPAGWQGPSGRSRSSGTAAPIVVGDAAHAYAEELDRLPEAYPGAKVWRQEGRAWVLTNCRLLHELSRTTILVLNIPASPNVVQGWGFWDYPGLARPEWIGPRHTNFPDGSICAFEPTDGTWTYGDPLVTLLDLYCVWALRHLHLQTYGRWPGRQAVHMVYERIQELRGDELCGCDQGTRKLYSNCCMKKDQAADQLSAYFDFYRRRQGAHRAPPNEVLALAAGGSPPAKAASP